MVNISFYNQFPTKAVNVLTFSMLESWIPGYIFNNNIFITKISSLVGINSQFIQHHSPWNLSFDLYD